jgi:transcriptional antiterminator NusG
VTVPESQLHSDVDAASGPVEGSAEQEAGDVTETSGSADEPDDVEFALDAEAAVEQEAAADAEAAAELAGADGAENLDESDESDDVAEPEPLDPVEEFTRELRMMPGDWYVVHSYAGYENRVKTNLESRITSLNMEDYIFQIEVPTHQVTEVKGGKKQTVNEKVLPGYILVRMDLTDESWAVGSSACRASRRRCRSARWPRCSLLPPPRAARPRRRRPPRSRPRNTRSASRLPLWMARSRRSRRP